MNGKKDNLSKDALSDVSNIVILTKEQADNDTRQFAKLKDHTIQQLVDYGVSDLPMLEKASHVRENILTIEEAKSLGYSVKNKHYHGLGVKTYLEIIHSMDNPIAIYQYTNKGKYSSDNFIVLTAIDINDKKAIVPVQINNNPGQYNNVEINYNKIKTSYFKDDHNYIQKLLNDGKIKEIFAGSDSQKTPLDRNNIAQFNCHVNSNISNYYSMQKVNNNAKLDQEELKNIHGGCFSFHSRNILVNCFYFVYNFSRRIWLCIKI